MDDSDEVLLCSKSSSRAHAFKDSRMQTTTYRAVLKGDHLEWRGETPPEIAGEHPVAVDVTILRDERFSASRSADTGERMAAAQEKLAASRAAAAIEDPVAWQREVRRDRPLPGRDWAPVYGVWHRSTGPRLAAGRQ